MLTSYTLTFTLQELFASQGIVMELYELLSMYEEIHKSGRFILLTMDYDPATETFSAEIQYT